MKKRNVILLYLFVIVITFSINVYADCGNTAMSDFVSQMNKYIYKPIKWGTPILLLVLTSFDFAKVVFSGDGKGMSKAANNFLKRSIAALIIFFAPDIIGLLASFIDNQTIASCSNGL